MAKCGEKTEVYSRVCGYFRPVSNWNKAGTRGRKRSSRTAEPMKSRGLVRRWFPSRSNLPSVHGKADGFRVGFSFLPEGFLFNSAAINGFRWRFSRRDMGVL